MAKKNQDGGPSVDRVREFMRLLGAFSRLASEALPKERLMHHATAMISDALGIKRVKVMRYRPEEGDLFVEAGVGWKPGFVGTATLQIDRRSPAGRALQTAQPITILDLPNNPDYRESSMLREHGIISLLNTPVLFDGQVWGVLEVDSDTPREFTEDEEAFLTQFASILGLALQRMETERRVEDERANAARDAAQREMLWREMQHRVKNNFQMVTALISLQRGKTPSPEARRAFAEVMERVLAISLAHDQLSARQSGERVNLRDYLRALCANIDPHRDGIRIEVSATAVELPIDRVVPLGLIVNELVSNALKHAFGDGGGTISVSFEANAEQTQGCLTVSDDGRGMGPPRPEGMGTDLVHSLAGQVGGVVLHPDVKAGTAALVRFPLAV